MNWKFWKKRKPYEPLQLERLGMVLYRKFDGEGRRVLLRELTLLTADWHRLKYLAGEPVKLKANSGLV